MNKELPVKLVTDFYDFYDHWFDRDGIVWERKAGDGIPRDEAFLYMSCNLGLRTPPVGTTDDLVEAIPPVSLLEAGDNIDVVVYLDQMAHCGTHKIKMNIMEACEAFPDHLSSMYIDQSTDHPKTTRWLKLGYHQHWLVYESDDDWRSNCGDVSVRQAEEDEIALFSNDLWKNTKDYPLCAIDFVQSSGGLWYAIDFNSAPGLRHTPIEDLKAEEVAYCIKEYIYDHQK